jgi:TolA-binding protein
MSLDGLRAWIGEVERKLGVRTRVFLVLAVIAVGGAAAGIYLGIDARNNDVSKSDLQSLQRRLEAQSGASPNVTKLEADLRALEAEVEELQGGKTGQGEGGKEAEAGGGQAGTGATGPSGATGKTGTGGASNGSVPPQKLPEAIKKAQRESEEAEKGK